MVLPESEVDFSAEDNVADEATLVETELSEHPVEMDVAESENVSQREHRVEESGKIVVCSDKANRGEHMVKEIESERIVVGDDEVNRDQMNVAEEDGEGEEHSPDEEEDAIENEENDADEEGNGDELAAEEDGDMDKVNNNEYDDDDDDDDDDDGDGDGVDVDVDVDDYDDVDADADDDVDDFDVDEDDFDVDEDDLLEEEGDVEHKESNVYDYEDDKENTVGGESEKVENEEKGGGSLEPKVKKHVKKNIKKDVVKRDSRKVTSKSEDKSERDGEKGPMVEGEEENAKEEIELKGEVKKRMRKNNRRKVSRGNSEKTKREDKVELARTKKTSKKVKSMGMIFMCSSKTKKDCYRYKVLGLPESKRDIVGKIYKGMRLFLYDVDLKLMYGIYKAAGPGGYNIEPKAFKSQFPSQVRFTVLDDCIPLAEEKFKKVIKENYFTRTKFDCQLKSDQVKNLCKLFVAASKGPRSKRLDSGLKEKTLASRIRGRPRARPLDDSRASRKRDRPRARPLDESRASRKRDRPTARALDEERYTLDEKRQYLGYPHLHQREVIASSLAPLSRIAPLRPPATAPSYAYDRTMETDAYRRNVLVDHRDAYRREPYIQPLLESRDAYRREPPLEHLDVHRLDPLLNHRDSYRRDAMIERRDLRPVNLEARYLDEMGRYDSYVSYRERQSYHDPVYIEHLSRDRDRHHPDGQRSQYQLRETAIPEYRSTRARYRY